MLDDVVIAFGGKSGSILVVKVFVYIEVSFNQPVDGCDLSVRFRK
jgi:hypothetical protein